MRWVFIILFLSALVGQSKYPADSLLASKDISIIHKIGILPIAGWQRISYNTNLLNCQFYPSCSNYGAEAVKQYGLIRGGAMASERIVRCNPFAFHYQLKYQQPFHQKDGRLEDPVSPLQHDQSKKSPILAGVLSTILPGAGRMYAGRVLDGIMGTWVMFMVGNTAYLAYKNEKPIAAPVYSTMAVFVYMGEIYGAWRAAKYNHPPEQSSFNSIN